MTYRTTLPRLRRAGLVNMERAANWINRGAVPFKVDPVGSGVARMFTKPQARALALMSAYVDAGLTLEKAKILAAEGAFRHEILTGTCAAEIEIKKDVIERQLEIARIPYKGARAA